MTALTLRICWHHGTILDLANALLSSGGVKPANLPAASAWPGKWPCEVFGWLLQIVYDAAGTPTRHGCGGSANGSCTTTPSTCR